MARRTLSPTHTPYPSPPKLIFVSSILSFMSFAGYTSYSPAKYALRGLADGLRNELLLVGIDVHCFFPTGILSPGFDTENLTKPGLCKVIEGSDEPLSPAKVASHLYTGSSPPPPLSLLLASVEGGFANWIGFGGNGGEKGSRKESFI